jgi:integrase
MPSLTKDSRGRSPFWFCCYTSADGQRLKKSTKQTDRSKAWETCLSIERAERFAKNGTLTEQLAKKIIGEIVERTSGQPLHDHKAGEWLEQWLAAKEQVRTGRTGERYRQVVRDFTASLGNRAKLALGHITPKDIFTYRNSILDAGKMARTANLSIKVISSAFNAALRQGYIASNPCTALESLPVESEEKGTFAAAQVAGLVKAAEGDWIGAILLGYYTGARLRDVANMRWEAIDLNRQLIVFTPSKTKKVVAVPLHPELETHLLKSPGIGKALLFPSLAGKGTGGRHGLSGLFSAIVAQAGIKSKVTDGGVRTRTSLSFHSLRHSFNSAMANAGVSQEIRQKLTGHASSEMNKHYTHHELEPLRAAIAVIPAISAKAAK